MSEILGRRADEFRSNYFRRLTVRRSNEPGVKVIKGRRRPSVDFQADLTATPDDYRTPQKVK